MIQKAVPADSGNLAALSIQVWLDTYAKEGVTAPLSDYVLSTFTRDYFQKQIELKSTEIWLYINEGQLVGFISVDHNATKTEGAKGYEVTRLYVSRHFQGKGVGKALVEHIKQKCGAPFWLTVWVGNDKALHFYHTLGFQKRGTTWFELDGELHENHLVVFE